jgi:sulfite dehydrogenase (quinone) subunit SoeC
MHPAYSVIIFTCASGAGYGLLCWLALSALIGTGAVRPFDVGIVAFGLAFALITAGLLSSTAHLGRPERAWRAFSQWRTSWLSREGVLALATYAAGGVFALDWLFGDPDDWLLLTLSALATLLCALATLWCTGMIYASLTTIRAWHQPLVAPLYVGLGLLTGRLLVNLIIGAVGGALATRAVWLTLLLLVAAWIAKAIYWSTIDDARRTHTIGDATGLGRFGKVRTLDPPHTQANFVMREMGFEVARKHADRLRQLATVLLFVVPLAVTMPLLVISSSLATVLLTLAAVLSAGVGVAVERWLFFAEAEHVAMLYYGRQAT